MVRFFKWGKKVKLLENNHLTSYEFNSSKLKGEIANIASKFYDYRNDTAHKLFASFLEKSVNLAMLELSDSRELTEAEYAYRRGRIDSIRGILLGVDRAISVESRESEAKADPKGADHKAKQSYLRKSRPIGEGLSH